MREKWWSTIWTARCFGRGRWRIAGPRRRWGTETFWWPAPAISLCARSIARAKRSGNGTPPTPPEYRFSNVQTAARLPNGNTIINNWFNEWGDKLDLGDEIRRAH